MSIKFKSLLSSSFVFRIYLFKTITDQNIQPNDDFHSFWFPQKPFEKKEENANFVYTNKTNLDKKFTYTKIN